MGPCNPAATHRPYKHQAMTCKPRVAARRTHRHVLIARVTSHTHLLHNHECIPHPFACQGAGCGNEPGRVLKGDLPGGQAGQPGTARQWWGEAMRAGLPAEQTMESSGRWRRQKHAAEIQGCHAYLGRTYGATPAVLAPCRAPMVSAPCVHDPLLAPFTAPPPSPKPANARAHTYTHTHTRTHTHTHTHTHPTD